MLDAFWKDDGVFWTDLPAWTSSDDVSLDASSVGVSIQEPTVSIGTIVQADALAVAMAAQTPDIVIVVAVTPDAIPMTSFVKDFGQFIESVVSADVVTAGAAVGDFSSGHIVFEYADFVPANMVPRDPYVFSEVILTPDVIPCAVATENDFLCGVLEIVNADVVTMATALQFYYFEITSLLVLDYLSIAGDIPETSVSGSCLIEQDGLDMGTGTYDALPVSNCVITADAISMSAGANDQGDTLFSSLFEHAALPLVVAPQNFEQRSLFTFIQDTNFSVLAALLEPAVSVDTFSAPSSLAFSLSDIMDFLVIASSNIEAAPLSMATSVKAFETSRSESFEQGFALSIASTLLPFTYAGRKAFEGVILETPVTQSIVVDTPVSLVSDFEGIEV